MYKKLITNLTDHIKTIIPEEELAKLQKILLEINLYIKAEELIALLIIITIIVLIITLIVSLIYELPLFLVIVVPLIIPLLVFYYIMYQNQKRRDEIEKQLPDYLRQLSSLLKVGLGLESSLRELSKHNNTVFSNQIKRVLLQMQFGMTLDEALMDVARNNNIDNLTHTFEIIIHLNQSGGNMSNTLEMIADDLSDTQVLQQERRAGVMMSVMFLIISSVIATPFALGMIRLYSEFLSTLGQTNPLDATIPIATMGYIIIHTILVSILISICLDSDTKKSFRYMIILVPASIGVYEISQIIFRTVLSIG
ncbi:MAG: type II secretion system F family protein [Methanosphaera sp.]|nr:type II secretion system F family protein [Methanosphaera sp.]